MFQKKVSVLMTSVLICTFFILGNTGVIPQRAYADNPNYGSYGDTNTTQFVPLANYNNSQKFQKAINSNSLPNYLNAVFEILLSIGALIAVIRLIWAGYLYMGSADMWSTKEQAKQMFRDTILGLLILFGVYLVLYQIDPNLLNIDLITTLKTAAASAQNVKSAVIGP